MCPLIKHFPINGFSKYTIFATLIQFNFQLLCSFILVKGKTAKRWETVPTSEVVLTRFFLPVV